MTQSETAPRLDLSDLVGVRFKRGGRDQEHGLDCAGVVLEVLSRLGIPPPLALESPTAACGATAVEDGWQCIGGDSAHARPAGRLLVSQGAGHCTEHVWVSLGDGTVATCLVRKGFRILSLGDIVQPKAVYAYDASGDHR